MTPTIPNGPYLGFTKAEIEQELLRYKAAVKQGGSALSGAAQSGQSYQFGPRRDWNLAEWSDQLQEALAYFGLADQPPGSNMVVTFTRNRY